MCRHTNYPSPGPHTGTLQWLKLLQHAAFSVMKHEPGAALALGSPGAGAEPSSSPAPHPEPPSRSSCLTFPSCSLCLGAVAVTQDWHKDSALDLPLPSPSRCWKRPSPPNLWKPTSLGWEKCNKMVLDLLVVFLHGRLFSAEIKG